MQEKEFVLYLIPLFFGPIVIGFIIDSIKKTHHYRLNDTFVNLQVALGNSIVGLVFAVISLGIYKIVFDDYSLFELDQMHVGTWLLAFILYDFLYYWTHRLHHEIALFWGSHVVHHSGEDMNYSLGIRQGIFSELTSWPFFLVLALSGVSLELFLALNAIQVIYQYFIHTTLIPKLGWLEKVIMTPALHRVHHARNRLYIDKNHGNLLVIWDQLFNSYQQELKTVPPVFGVRESIPGFSPIAINLQYYKVILKKLTYSNSLAEVFKSLFNTPSWLPANAKISDFRNEISQTPSNKFKKYNPELSNLGKLSSAIRFVSIFFISIFLIWNLSIFEWWGSFSLFVLFAWVVHYNGLVLDGVGSTWKLELITQVLVILVGTMSLFSDHFESIIIGIVIFSFISLFAFALLHFFIVNKKPVEAS